jgi:RimJ/RimL family protein N-acetyltransferase
MPPLIADRVALREFRPEDVEDVLAIVGDDRVTRWLSVASRNREQTERMLSAPIAAARTEYDPHQRAGGDRARVI